MEKTIPEVIPTLIPLSPNTIYRVGFHGEGVQLYRNRSLKWRPHFQEVGNGQIRFFGRTEPSYYTLLVMVSTMAWPPTHGPQPDTGNVTALAPAFFTQVNINRSRFREELWTSGTAKKTIGILATNVVRSSSSSGSEYQRVIKLLDIRGGASPGESTKEGEGEGESSPMGELFWTSYPQWLEKHGLPLSLDMDDARGRMGISMSDGTLAVIEFV